MQGKLAAIVLAGGAARRLSGVDKPGLVVGGRTLLARALDAVGGAEPVVVVGPRRDIGENVVWTREEPPGGGPLAGLAAGVRALSEVDGGTPVAVLAGDLVGVRPTTVNRLRAALDGDGAVLVDAAGEPQWLIGVWRLAALRGAIPQDSDGGSLRRVLGRLSYVEVPAEPGEADDVDTPEDLHRHGG
ncbi:molybdopterin-guanine dinucleotide biosynthesis protein A [Herbihabitans rhizosphaerae]|uniref:Molybdopterin-guanine dinucleotide biosynthesis protein A n=1 Tax=Herbihabitans rhizosphaerae TaxID=1872711 RepID=A0A4Q7L237_9PSEU|nr:molybdenum cofactor guanylyltransferase [Herbihabitans rhizosphaerae]RZS43267.1 molybdopterin-guanine dinucleotide biosynthesis protein A [Herbihabitans rhizosphaerae]